MIHPILTVCVATLLLSACGGRPKPSDGLVGANLAALEQTVDMESPAVESDGVLRFERTTIPLGEVPLGETRHVTLRATNATEQPLVLLEVTTACGCTKVEWPRKPIPPHSSAELRIAFTAEQKGAFFKKIAVRHSAGKHPVAFLIEGIVTARRPTCEDKKR